VSCASSASGSSTQRPDRVIVRCANDQRLKSLIDEVYAVNGRVMSRRCAAA
jgi:hypothetical protein